MNIELWRVCFCVLNNVQVVVNPEVIVVNILIPAFKFCVIDIKNPRAHGNLCWVKQCQATAAIKRRGRANEETMILF